MVVVGMGDSSVALLSSLLGSVCLTLVDTQGTLEHLQRGSAIVDWLEQGQNRVPFNGYGDHEHEVDRAIDLGSAGNYLELPTHR